MSVRERFDSDNSLREIAGLYVKEYGEELLREAERLEGRGVDQVAAMRLERRVRMKIAAENRTPWLRVAVAFAACFALLMIPLLARLPSAAPPAASEAAAPEAEGYEVIPLSAPLPAGFTETGVEQDNEKSVYYLSDVYQDDVVMTLEYAPRLADTAGLTPLPLGDTMSYGAAKDGYSLLTFHREGILYTLTCRYDVNTLLRLGRGLV